MLKIKKYGKVKGYCRYTGEYIGESHNICKSK